MASILEKLKAPPGEAPPAHWRMMVEMSNEAMKDARLQVQGDIDAANRAMNAATIRADVAETEHRAAVDRYNIAEAAVEEMKGRLAQSETNNASLKNIISLEQDAGRSLQADSQLRGDAMQGELRDALKTVQGLTEQVGAINKQLAAKPKSVKSTPAPAPAPIVSPVVIPDFTVENVIRGGPNDRIVSATIKAVRTN